MLTTTVEYDKMIVLCNKRKNIPFWNYYMPIERLIVLLQIHEVDHNIDPSPYIYTHQNLMI